MVHLDMLEQASLSGCQEAEPDPGLRRAGGQGRASILQLPKSLGLTGGGGRGSGFFSLVPAMRPCFAGSWWPVTHLSHGDKAPGSARLGRSAPMPRNLESGCAWALGVSPPWCPERGWHVTCVGGHRGDRGWWCPAPTPRCPVFRAQLAPWALSEQTRMPCLLLPCWAAAGVSLPPCPPETGLHRRRQGRRGGRLTHTSMHRIYFSSHFNLAGDPGGGGAHTLGAANTFQPSSWPILTNAAIVPMYAHAAAPIP